MRKYTKITLIVAIYLISACSNNNSSHPIKSPTIDTPDPVDQAPNMVLNLPAPLGLLNAPTIESQTLVGGTKIHGVNFGPFVSDGSNPIDTILTEEDLMPLLEGLADYTHWIRTFGTTNGLDMIPELSHTLGLSTAVGAWIDSDIETNNTEIEKVITLSESGYADMVIIGSEVLLRNDLTEQQLVTHINQAKAGLPGKSIACAEDVIRFIDNASYREACDIWLVNYYPYVHGISINGAIAALNGYYNYLVSIADGKPILISETGWPTSGPQYGDAVASANNAAFYFINFISWAESRNIDYFYFEAYNEPWKEEGGAGPHWGIFDRFGNLKPSMEPVFNGYTINNNWN